MLLLASGLAAACNVDIYHDLSERRASESLLALRAAGIHAEKRIEQRGSGGRPGVFALSVPRSDETRALALLADRGLPRPPEASVAGSGKLLFLPSSQHAEATAAHSAAVAETLERMPEVAEARVHLALPEPEPFSNQGSLRPTAAVYLKLRAPLSVAPIEIAQLVAHAVPGLDAQDVSVLSTQGASNLPASGAALTQLGPFRVAPESRSALLFLLGALCLLGVACAGLGVLAWPRRKTAAAGASSGPKDATSASPPRT